MSEIELHLKQIKDKLKTFNCTLIAVSKTQSIEKILEAYHSGHLDFGENKVQELVEKYETLPKDIHWHMIGHLQTNKVKYIVPFVYLIHSVDSMKLLEEINKQAFRNKKVQNVLLQIYIAQEETKFGFSLDELEQVINDQNIANLKNINIKGLMAMATNTDNITQIENEFGVIQKLFNKMKNITKPNISMEHLSIGMSSDYEIALKKGATYVRVGSAIFGERNY